jgi:prepilin-type N-terminal cleavage/methylation domain-containing protein
MILVRRSSRGAFTLVELLVTILIITIMATMVLFALAGVTEQARVDRTKAQIAKINDLIMEKWESYQTRRVPIPYLTLIQDARRQDPGAQRNTDLRRVARDRLQALRELLRMELPDRITDVDDGPVVLKDSTTKLPFRPALSRAYLQRAQGNGQTGTTEHQDSECLYLI